MVDKKVVDLSRFLLFEEAGDSQRHFGADHDDQWNNYSVVLADKGNDQEDDAESCICAGNEEDYGVSYEDQKVYEIRSDSDDDDHDHEYGDVDGIGHHHHHNMSVFEEEEEEEEEEMVSEVASTANSYSTRKCVQSRNKSLSEMDKNRLFWEACLAS